MKISLSNYTRQDLIDYWKLCSKYVEINQESAVNETLDAIRLHKTGKEGGLSALQKRWYDSLENDLPDYTVYDDPKFLVNLWVCWVTYSRKYLKSLEKHILSELSNIKTVVDLGCGVGYTTAGLKKLFPEAKVFGTNFDDEIQYKIAVEIANDNDFTMLPDSNKLQNVDLVFASEYFEHVENAIEHLENIVAKSNPRYFIIANAFNTSAIGHFSYYLYNERWYDGRITSRMFNKTLKRLGYAKVKTKCWNDRPTFWRKTE